MNTTHYAGPLSKAARVALLAALFSGFVPVFAGGNPDATMTIESDPVGIESDPNAAVSVSRDATAQSSAVDFYISYRVRITNPTNSSKNFRFVGDVAVAGPDATTFPTDFVPSRTDCTFTGTQVTCPRLEVAKRATVTVTFQFRTPTAGTQMSFSGGLYFPVTSTSQAVSAATAINLKELLVEDYRVGFSTFVPMTGGTFWTGISDSQSSSPGGVATESDPWTTTVNVPPILFTTQATVKEKSLAACSASVYAATGCFESNLKIPGSFASLTIYLRIDRTKISWTAPSIAVTPIYYQKDPTDAVPNPPVQTLEMCAPPKYQPNSGVPCILERKVYDTTNMPNLQWFGDREYTIRALDNGRYFN